MALSFGKCGKCSKPAWGPASTGDVDVFITAPCEKCGGTIVPVEGNAIGDYSDAYVGMIFTNDAMRTIEDKNKAILSYKLNALLSDGPGLVPESEFEKYAAGDPRLLDAPGGQATEKVINCAQIYAVNVVIDGRSSQDNDDDASRYGRQMATARNELHEKGDRKWWQVWKK